jgi:hypothetical protein
VKRRQNPQLKLIAIDFFISGDRGAHKPAKFGFAPPSKASFRTTFVRSSLLHGRQNFAQAGSRDNHKIV